MSSKAQDLLKIFRPRRIIYPIVLGLGVATFFLFREFDADAFKGIDWGWNTVFWLFMALLMMVVRDLGYLIRIRVLAEKKISWRNSLDVVMLWEFASAITPSVVGGSAVAMFFINKEGINFGKSSSIVLITALMDELFFVLMVPFLYLLVGSDALFPAEAQQLAANPKHLFFISYLIIVIYVVAITYALLFKPRGFKWLLLKLFSIPFLRRFRYKANEVGNQIIVASQENRNQPPSFWIKAFIATFFSWTARYWVVNFMLLAFVSLTFSDHLIIYARQLSMWIVLLISPTPGGSGFAEVAFDIFLEDFTPSGLTSALGLLWRLISYYPYLFIGAVILPRWIKRVFTPKEAAEIKVINLHTKL